MAELRLSQASRDALQAHCATPEGRAALDELARLIAQTALDAMPPDLMATLETEQGMAAFRKAWPDRGRVPVPGCMREGCAGWYAAGSHQGREAAATGSGEVVAVYAIESRG